MVNGVVFMASPDTRDNSIFNLSPLSCGPYGSIHNRAGGTYLFGSSGSFSVPSSQFYYVKFSSYNNGGSNYIHNLMLFENSVNHLHFQIDGGDSCIYVRLNNNGAVIDEYERPGGWSLDVWHVFEIYALIDDTVGAYIIKVDGDEVLNGANKDTRVGTAGLGRINAIRFENSWAFTSDIVVRDDAWPGVGAVYVLPVTGDGDDTGWTASTGNRWDCVNEIPPSDTDYIYTDAGVAGVKNGFGLTDLGFTPKAVNGVGVAVKGKLATAGSGKFRAFAKLGANYSQAADLALSVSNQWSQLFMAEKPGGGAWDLTAVDSLQAGVETRT